MEQRLPGYYDPPKANTPWHRQFDYWRELADRYINAFRAIPEDEKLYTFEAHSLARYIVARLIFETNTLEQAGLSSEGETRKVLEEFPEVPNSYEAFRKADVTDFVMTAAVANKIDQAIAQYRGDAKILHSVKFVGKSRSIKEVGWHSLAFRQAMFCLKVQTDFPGMLAAARNRDKLSLFISEAENIWSGFVCEKQTASGKAPPAMFCENFIKELHYYLAKDLLSKQDGVTSGEYRIDDRSIQNSDVIFPAPELVSEAMKKYVEFANLKVIDFLEGKIDRYSATAEITYRFLMIHPFPDFNGRLSRLLLTMFLQFSGCPFPVSVLGDKRNRKNYLTSLKMANRNRDTTAYAAWIAKKMVEQFQEFDRKMELVGRESVLSFL